MFWKKNKLKPKESIINNSSLQTYTDGEFIFEKIQKNDIYKRYNKTHLMIWLEQINDWLIKAHDDRSPNIESLKIKIIDIKTNIEKILEIHQYKDDFFSKINVFEKSMTEIDQKLQEIAKNIPKTMTLYDLQKTDGILLTYKEILSFDIQALRNNVKELLDREDNLRYDRIIDFKDNLNKKLSAIQNSIMKKKDKIEIITREESIAGERKKMFSWADTCSNRLQRFRIRIDKLFEETKELDNLTQIKELKSKVNILENDINIALQPPVSKTPEIQTQTKIIVERLKSEYNEIEKAIKELHQLFIQKIIALIAQSRADRLEKYIRHTKRLTLKAFIEILRSWEVPLTSWLKTLNYEEPLRLQTPNTVVFSMERLYALQNKNLHNYLENAMLRYTHFEWESQATLHKELLNRFLETEKFN